MRKPFNQTKLGIFLKEKAPALLESVGDVLPDSGSLGLVKNLIRASEMNREDKERAQAEVLAIEAKLYELDKEDRADARGLYAEDSEIQKIFAILFLVFYVFLTVVVLYGVYLFAVEKVALPNYIVGFVSTIYGAFSVKVSTIIDFFFGSSSYGKAV
ncbi:MAG: hypothetical protein ACYS71_07945 [Planctomycetota bacterium]|jgi:hypothetical protein